MNLYRHFTSQEEIDLEYNLSLTVPDSKRWVEWYVQKSAIARQTLDCILDVSYGSGEDETIDIFPAKEQNAPVLVYIHGGFWFSGSSKDYSFVAKGFVSRGFTVVVMNYSLCPKVTIAEITRQSRTLIAWIYKEASAFNADPFRIFVSGHSAGGHQVGMLLDTEWHSAYGLPDDTIKGGISISGLFDLQPFYYSYLQPKLLLTQEIIIQESPYLHIPDTGAPLLITYGGEETAEFHRQSMDYLQAWRNNGLHGELLIQEGKHHFSAIAGLNDPNSALCNVLVDFMLRERDG